MALSKYLKDYLKQDHMLQFVDNGDWNSFYASLSTYDMEHINDVTDFLITRCGIDPTSELKIIPYNYRRNDQTLTDLTISPKTIEIWDNAFRDCKNLRTIKFPSSVKSVKEFAFKGCTNIEEIYIQGEDTLIDVLAFTFVEDFTATINYKNERMIAMFEDIYRASVRAVKEVKL